jgi:hypothetical protein
MPGIIEGVLGGIDFIGLLKSNPEKSIVECMENMAIISCGRLWALLEYFFSRKISLPHISISLSRSRPTAQESLGAATRACEPHAT